MYSPKIDENLIPVLYRAAKDRGIAMTKLVNRLLTRALANENLSETTRDALQPSPFSRKVLRHHLNVIRRESASSPVIQES